MSGNNVLMSPTSCPTLGVNLVRGQVDAFAEQSIIHCVRQCDAQQTPVVVPVCGAATTIQPGVVRGIFTTEHTTVATSMPSEVNVIISALLLPHIQPIGRESFNLH